MDPVLPPGIGFLSMLDHTRPYLPEPLFFLVLEPTPRLMKNTDRLQTEAVYAPDFPAIQNFAGGWDLAQPPPSRAAGRRRLPALSVCLSFDPSFPMVAHVPAQASPVPMSVPAVCTQIPDIPVQVAAVGAAVPPVFPEVQAIPL